MKIGSGTRRLVGNRLSTQKVRPMGQSADPVRIVIAHEGAMVRGGLRKLLEAEPDLRVIGEAADGVEAVEAVRQLEPDLLLLDLTLLHRPDLRALREIEALSTTPVRTIVLAAATEKAQVAQAFQLGARGVTLEESVAESLLRCIRAVMAGRYWAESELVFSLVEALRDLLPSAEEQEAQSHYGITPDEMEVIAAVVNGSTNQDISQRFSLSEQAVEECLNNIFHKVGVSSRWELALFAVNHGLVG